MQLHNSWQQAPVAGVRHFHFSRPVAGAAGDVSDEWEMDVRP